MAATVTGAFVVLDRASRPIRRIRDEAIQADVAVKRLGASLDRIGTHEQRNMLNNTADQIRSLAGESHGAAEETEVLAERLERAGSPQMARNLNTSASSVRNVRTASRDGAADVRRFSNEVERVEVKAKGARQELSLFGGAMNGLRGGAMAALIPMIGLLAQGIGALGAGVIELLPNLASFAALAAPVATGITGIGLAAISAKLAFKDFGKAMSSTGKAHEKALAKMTPEARSFLRVIREYQPLVKDLQASSQRGLFPGLETAIRRLAAVAPMANQVLEGFGRRVGNLAANAAGQVSTTGFQRDFQIIADQGMHAVTQLGRGILNLIQAFRNFMVVGAPFTHWIIDTVYGFTEYVKGASIAGRETGNLARWFTRAQGSLTTFGHIARNVFEFVGGVLKAATGQSDRLYGSIDKTTGKWADWAQSAHGQHDMRQYFAEMEAPLHAIVNFVGALGLGLGKLSVGGGFTEAMNALSTAVPGLVQGLGSLASGIGVQFVGALSQTLQLISTLVGGAGGDGPLVEMLKLLNGVLGSINGLVQNVPGLGRVLATAFTIVAVRRFSTAIGDLASKWLGVAGAASKATEAQAAAMGAGAGAGRGTGGGLGGFNGRSGGAGAATGAGGAAAGGAGWYANWRTNSALRSQRASGFGPGGALGASALLAARASQGLTLGGAARNAVSGSTYGIARGFGYGRGASALAQGGALGGAALSRGGAMLGAAGRFAWPIAAFQAGMGALGTQGDAYERLQGAGSSATFGLIHAPTTIADARAQGQTAAQQAVARNSTAVTVAGMSSQLNNLRLAQSRAQAAGTVARNNGGGFLGHLGRAELGAVGIHPGGQTISEADAKKNAAAVKVYNSAITRIQRQQHAQSVQEATTAGQQMAVGLGQAFEVYSRAHGIHKAMRETTRDAVNQITNMGPVGGRAVAANMLTWAHEQASQNPKLWKQYQSLENRIEDTFDHLGRHVRVINGQILDGTAKQWAATGQAISSPMEQALERTSRYFTQLQQIAAGQLQMMGFSQAEANGIIRGSETISKMTGGKVSGASALGAAQGMAASGARYAAQGKAAGGKRGATGMRIPGMGLSDHVPVNGLAAPGELIVNRHTERRVDSLLNRVGTSLGSLVAGETKPHGEPLFATGGRAESVGHGSGLQAGIQGAVNRVLGQFPGLSITSTTGGGHAANSYHYRGMAADLGGDAATMLRAASWIKRTMGTNLTEGIHNPNLSIKGGKTVPSSFWGPQVWGDHANHIHLAVAGALGALGGLGGGGVTAMGTGGGGSIKLPRVGRGPGVAGAAASRIQNRLAAAMEHQVNAAIGGGAGGGGAAYSGGGSLNQWLTQALRITGHYSPANLRGLRAMAMGESGGNPNARQSPGVNDVNMRSGNPALGLLQMIPQTFSSYAMPGHSNIMDPVDNAISSIRYQFSRYGRIVGHSGYAMGGRVPGWGGWNAKGGTGSFRRPTLIGVGEGAQAEDVSITPHENTAGSGSSNSTGGGKHVHLHIHPGAVVIQGGGAAAGREAADALMERLASLIEGMGMESETSTA